MNNFNQLQIYSDYLYSKKEYACRILVKSVFEREIFPAISRSKIQYFVSFKIKGWGCGILPTATINYYSHYRQLSYGNGFDYGIRLGSGEGLKEFSSLIWKDFAIGNGNHCGFEDSENNYGSGYGY